jgi:hypothetical protein
MGNKNTPPSKKSQPTRVLPSGQDEIINPGGGGIGVGYNHLSKITIKLVRINLSVMRNVSLNDNVMIEWRDEGYYCLFSNQILGKVPANYNDQLNKPMNHWAVIVGINKLTPEITIEIEL